MLRCIYCGYCQEVCPEEAIFLQEEYSSKVTPEEMVNDKAKLYELGGTLPDQHYKWIRKSKPRTKEIPIDSFLVEALLLI